MKFINGDITGIKFGFICHQVNCQGKMGAGVALAIRRKWPIAYNEYMAAHDKKELQLGNVIFATVSPDLYVVHLCGQNRYGYKGVFTNYDALHKAVCHVSEVRNEAIERIHVPIPIYFPNKMGSGFGGGDWKIVSNIISTYIEDAIIVNYSL